MTQRYTSETARARMALGTCPECGQAPEQHLESNAFWLPRNCDLMPSGVTDRIAAFREEPVDREPILICWCHTDAPCPIDHSEPDPMRIE